MSEMQRVALGRALVTEPRLLLLDEPMSNLDAHLRQQLRTELKQIQAALDQTVLYVTHDQLEAMSMSDRIAVMHEGRLQQLGTPDAIYHRPVNRFVAEFIGDPPINVLPCSALREADDVRVDLRARRGGAPAGRRLCRRRARARRSGRMRSPRIASRPPARCRPWSASSRISAPSMCSTSSARRSSCGSSRRRSGQRSARPSISSPTGRGRI